MSQELSCLRQLVPGGDGWLELGTGTGHFAQALGIPLGVDPSQPALSLARSRGIRVLEGRAEALQLESNSQDGVLMVVTLCFVQDPLQSLREAARVLHQGGSLVLGLVPADSPWGQEYQEKARTGHAFYSFARFYGIQHVLDLAKQAGFQLSRAMSCLLEGPRDQVDPYAAPFPGTVDGAGFVAMEFKPAQEPSAGPPDHSVGRGGAASPGQEPPGKGT